MDYFNCRRRLSSCVTILLLVHSVPNFALQIRGLQVINDDTGTFSGPLGFPRNFSWYGSSTDNRNDYKRLLDIINFPEDGTGQVHSYPSLVHSGCPTPFRIPKDLNTSSIYTIYWLWNTTEPFETGFQVKFQSNGPLELDSDLYTFHLPNSPGINGRWVYDRAPFEPVGYNKSDFSITFDTVFQDTIIFLNKYLVSHLNPRQYA
ncbi:uncharacterized protein KD926_007465 [Aspergillus affinis]|uniref:uncharacterized protein n=1 Tax=Aspergillus affinis TaxID=1070780 RepID=UPI0022FE3C76|nr:uncharacterized protein KD926_007465 [Aspergillus affinis]KAI9041048.1 hypothetical protein KD926_007465 [Aspergillus affinis]